MNDGIPSPKRPGRLRLRFALAMGVFGIACGMLMTALIGWRLAQGVREGAEARLQAIASETAVSLNQSLAGRMAALILIADLATEARPGHVDAVRRQFDAVADANPDFAWLGLTDATGKVLAGRGGLLEGQDTSARPWFAAGLRGPHLGDPHAAVMLDRLLPARPDGEPLRFVDLAVPVRDDQGAARGVLVAHLHIAWMQRVIAQVMSRHPTLSLDVRILDEAGQSLLAAPRLPDPSADEAPLVARAAVGSSTDRAALNWTVVVRQPAEQARAPLQAQQRFMLGLTPALALLFALGTWWIAGRAVQPVVRLAESARRLTASSQDDETEVVDQALEQLARRDPLTGVANRATLIERLDTLGAHPAREDWAALLLVDLDDFSTFNNSNGRAAGDALLRAVAGHLLTGVRLQDLVARTGGDEFAIVLTGLGPVQADALRHAEDVARRAEAACRSPVQIEARSFVRRVSIGVMVYAPGQTATTDVLKDAELTVKEAKRLGGGRCLVFTRELHARFDERVELEQGLREALPHQLQLHYQPQVDADGRLLGAELLLRWQHPRLGPVSPARFIPVAEASGLIVPIGRWIVESACRQLAQWATDPARRHLSLAVNVSAREFAEPAYAESVHEILQRTGAPARRLKLELTESTLATDIDDVVAKMRTLRAAGVQFALDDFGTGFSSLSYLKRLPIDQLKIDQSFVRELDAPGADLSIVRAIIGLARGLDLSVIAEGVETESQRALLDRLGCRQYQGYLFGRPVPLESFLPRSAPADDTPAVCSVPEPASR